MFILPLLCLTELHPPLFHKHFGMEHLKLKSKRTAEWSNTHPSIQRILNSSKYTYTHFQKTVKYFLDLFHVVRNRPFASLTQTPRQQTKAIKPLNRYYGAERTLILTNLKNSVCGCNLMTHNDFSQKQKNRVSRPSS